MENRSRRGRPLQEVARPRGQLGLVAARSHQYAPARKMGLRPVRVPLSASLADDHLQVIHTSMQIFNYHELARLMSHTHRSGAEDNGLLSQPLQMRRLGAKGDGCGTV